jgi:hypothetical protein
MHVHSGKFRAATLACGLAAALTAGTGGGAAAAPDAAPPPVILYAWPDGGTAQIAGTVTPGSGAVTQTPAQAAALQAAAAPGGTVNLEAVTLAAGEFASWSFTASAAQVAGGALAMPALDATAAPVQASDVAAFAQSAQAGDSPGAVECGWVYRTSYAPAWTVVGGTYDTTNNVTQSFSYTSGQTTTLGVGTSASGDPGTFSLSGAATVSATYGEAFPPSTGPRNTLYETAFSTAEYGYTCGDGYLSEQVRPGAYAGGARIAGTSAPSAPYCLYQIKGSTFTKDATASVTYSGAATVSAIAFSLTAQTGWDNSASITYTFGGGHYLCGTDGYPGGDPREIVAGKV